MKCNRILIFQFFIFLFTSISIFPDSIYEEQQLFISSHPLPGKLEVDEESAKYRTGEIDPVIAEIPMQIQTGVFSNPLDYLPRLINFLKADADNEYHIVKRIHDWITDNIAYDLFLFWGVGTGSRQTYELLPLKRTTCGGFSRLFKEMADLAGIEAVVIEGISRSFLKSNGKPGGHVWNAVRINTKWYIVDTTHDSRISIRGNLLSEKDDYDDLNLFILPEAKVLINLANDPEWQLIDNSVAEEDFLAAPQFSLPFLEYIYYPADNSIYEDRNIIEIPKEKGSLLNKADSFLTNGNVYTMAFIIPHNVRLHGRLYDANENRLYNYSFSYRTGDTYYVQFSVPEKGLFNANIIACFTDREKKWRQVYEFYIQENIAQGPLLPLPGWIFPKTEFFHYGLEITPDTVGDDFSQGPFKLKESAIFPDYFEFTVSMPESVMWKAQLYDLDGNIVYNHLFSTWININARKYYVSSPGAGYYHGKLWVKNRG